MVCCQIAAAGSINLKPSAPEKIYIFRRPVGYGPFGGIVRDIAPITAQPNAMFTVFNVYSCAHSPMRDGGGGDRPVHQCVNPI